MNPERWRQVEELYNSALKLEPQNRAAYLDSHCSNDLALRAEVESLLQQVVSGNSFMDEPALEFVAKELAKDKPSPRESGLQPGSVIGNFRILEKLGGGGMGVVYKAEDLKLRRNVALKFLPQDMADDALALERLQREARSASALNHPNICTIYSIEEHDGTDYLVMELLEGETLAARLEQGVLPLKEALSIGIDIAEALQAAHSKGVIHRDIKPGNVFLTERGTAKVLDFGLAKLAARLAASATIGGDDSTRTAAEAENLTDSGAAVGTVAYMSPEQVRGEKLDARSDLFSFGATLYEMFTGVRPFLGRTSALTFNAILNLEPIDPVRRNPSLPVELGRILNTALEKDRELRYQSAAALGADLKRLKRDSESPRSPEAWQAQRPTSGAPPIKNSIAVLPLQNMSGDPTNEYFSDGMSEEISTKLSRIQDLTVAPYFVTARLKNSQKAPQDIGRELRVRYLLDGSIRKAEDQIRINVRLTDASTGFQVWADDFRSKTRDVFTVQEQAALKIADALNLHLSPQDQQRVQRRYTQNADAYDEFLRGRALALYYANRDAIVGARKHFQRALDLDPNYAPALAGLARVEAICYRQFEPDESHLRCAEQLVQRALAIDPQLAEAKFAMGQIAGHRYDYQRAAEILREVTRSRPEDAEAWDLLAWALGYQYPPDPIESERAAREAIKLQPSLSGAYYHLGRALILQGRHLEARGAFEHGRELHPSGTGDLGLAQLHLAEGNPGQAVTLLEKVVRRRGGVISLFWLAAAYSANGSRDKAVATMQKAFDAGFSDFAAIDASPYLAPLVGELKRLRQTNDSSRSGTADQRRSPLQRGQRYWVIVLAVGIAVGLLVAGYFYAHRSVAKHQVTAAAGPTATKSSIAVLPFQNLSGDTDNQYFSDGMTEEIITKLSRIKSLDVASRTSVARFKATQEDVKEIGSKLGVRYVLEGSVRKAPGRVRITAQLIDASTGFHLWADDFDRDLKDVFQVQEETALKIAEALNLHLTPQEEQAVQHRYTQNPEAYDAYLRGQALTWNWSESRKLELARTEFEKALQLDPHYPLALAGLSRVESFYYRNVKSDEIHIRRAEEYAQRALSVDPQLAQAHVSLALVYAGRFEYAKAAQEAREATRLEPGNAEAWVALSWVLGYEQPPEAIDAEKAAREAIRLQPSVEGSYYELGRALLLQRRFSEAMAAMKQARELNEASTSWQLGLAAVYLAQGDAATALSTLEKIPSDRFTSIMLVQLSATYAAHGDKKEALDVLQRALAAGYRDFAALDASPYFASLRSDPRFQQLIQRYHK